MAEEYKFKLAKYLLNYSENAAVPEIDANEFKVDAHLYTDAQISAEITEILQRIKPYARPALSGFHAYVQHHTDPGHLHAERAEKRELLEEHHVHDTDLLNSLKDFLIMTIALLVKLERMHKKHILCGNINPYTFMYSKKNRSCEPVDLGVILSDKHTVQAEKQPFGPYMHIVVDLGLVPYNKYLAPELKESIRVYHLKRRLNDLATEAEKRGIAKEQRNEIAVILHDFHQRGLKYSNRAEIYSVGYTINQIFSHTLSKLAHFNLRMNEFVQGPVATKIIHEAELLLPDSFANPQDERITGLVNEAIKYTYDLMQEHMEKRDTLELSIEKFTSLLKRTGLTKPDTELGEEEEEAEEEWLEKVLEEREEEKEEEEEKEAEEEGEEDTEEEREEVEVEEAEEPEGEEAEKEEETEEQEEAEEEEPEEAEEKEEEEPEEAEEEEPEEAEEEEEEEPEEEEGEEAEEEEGEEAEEEEQEEHEEHVEHEEHEEHGEHAKHDEEHAADEHGALGSHDDDEHPPEPSALGPGHHGMHP